MDAAVVTGADRCEVTLFLRTRTVTVSYTGSFDGGSAVCAASAETLRVGEEEMPPALAASAPEVLAAAGLEETACTFCGYCMNLPKGYTVSEPGPEMTLAEAPNGRDCVTFQTADGSAKNTGRSAFDRTLRETIPGYGGITAFQTGKLNDVLDATFLSFNADISGETASVTQFWLFGPYRDPILVTVTQYGDDGHDALAAAIDTIRPAPPRSVSAEELTGSGGAALELTEDAHVFSGVRMNLPLGMTVSETLLGDIGVMPNGEGPTFAFAVLPTETDKSPIRVASFYTRFDGFEALASNEVVQLGGTAASVSSAETSDGPVVMALVYFPDRCVQIVGRDAQPDTLRACFATLAVG
ncbi:MAG: hypothetical protein IK136_03640 [Oscillospiraceae bacterium]|nr:hypothetical protein [Oscillospiraceae bacterium]